MVIAENPEDWCIGPVDCDGSGGTSCCILGQFEYSLSNPRVSSSFPMHVTPTRPDTRATPMMLS